MARLAAIGGLNVAEPRLRTRFAGIDLPNPVGLAAGFDKNCELIGALSCLGFGFLTVGSVMPQPRYGNPFRAWCATGNAVARRRHGRAEPRPGVLRRAACGRYAARQPLFANVGGFSAAEIAASLMAVEPHVDAVEISLMCPNVQPGERFDELALLRDVLARIEGRRKPAIVRVPNDTAVAPDRLAEMIERCVAAGIDGLKVAGGKPVAEPRLGTGQGTLHGGAIFERALANVERAAGLARGRIAIKGNGGVMRGADALAMLRAGAACVDLYSAFVYRGWSVARDINRELLDALQGQSVAAVGARSARPAARAGVNRERRARRRCRCA